MVKRPIYFDNNNLGDVCRNFLDVNPFSKRAMIFGLLKEAAATGAYHFFDKLSPTLQHSVATVARNSQFLKFFSSRYSFCNL